MKKLLRLLSFVVLGALLAADSEAAPLSPRRPADKIGCAGLPPATPARAVVLKLHEGTRVRLRGGELTVVSGGAREDARLASLGLTREQVQADLRAAHALVAAHGSALGLERLFAAGESVLATARAAGEIRSGRELADLDLYYRVPLRPGTTVADVDDLVQALNALASVEVAYAEPPPSAPAPAVDLHPPTPDFTGQQGYLNAAPLGIDARYAWTVPGGRGQGVKIVDVEGAWNTHHEDLPFLFYEGGPQTTTPGWLEHGTAVLGAMVAVDNGYGVTGVVPAAQAGYQSFEPQGGASAIVNAALAAGAGGVVLVELQMAGPPTPTSFCNCSSPCCDCVPVEYNQAEFDAIAQATANGTIVIEAGANGATDLDDPIYGGRFNRSVRDSGAILSGASESTGRQPTCFTNYGSRVDVHGWGRNLVTTGFGSLFEGNGDPNQRYSYLFMGTSAASPVVTGAAAALQGIARADGRAALTSRQVRELLRGTGTPQATDPRLIGPLPNLRAAIATLLAPETDFWALPPCRVIDTRAAAGPSGGPVLTAGMERSFALHGLCGIPASARAVAANLTVVGPTAPGYLTVHPADMSPANTSVINFGAGQLRSNNAILRLAADGPGAIMVLPGMADGTVHLVVDVTGYFAP